MDKENPQKIWEQLLTDLTLHKENAGCLRWLKKALPKTQTEDTLFLEVANNFIKDWIQNNYKELLEGHLTQLAKRPMHFTIQVKPEEGAEQPAKTVEKSAPEPVTTAPRQIPSQSAKPEEEWQSNLSPKYEFENFIVGKSNEMAHAAAIAVAENPSDVYNPFFLYSDSGMGKTHLMNAIGNRIHKNHPEMKILYTTSEAFTNDLIESIAKNQTEANRNKYRNIDVLIIDDIQFLKGKESTQQEFFHTFNALEKANKQIIISSDRPPSELTTLEERLTSRFSSGLIVDIQHPDLETRCAILQNMAQKDHLQFPQEVIQLIAMNVKTNIRELEGAYTRVRFYAMLNHRPITIELAKAALKDLRLDNTAEKIITVEAIQQAVAAKYKIKPEELKDKTRTRTVAYPRQIAMYLTRELTDLSLPKIAEFFRRKDHTTVLYACEKIAAEKEKDTQLERQLTELTEELKK